MGRNSGQFKRLKAALLISFRARGAAGAVILAIICCLVCSLGAVAEQFTARTFADANGQLDEAQAALYIVYRDNVPLSKVMAPGQTTLDFGKVRAVTADKVDDLISKTHHEAPWTWQELDQAYPPKKPGKEEEAALPRWRRIEGITEPKPLGPDGSGGSFGPFMLRKNSDELTQSDVSKAKGATLAYSRNALKSGSGALNSEGILDYPTKWELYQGEQGRSVEARADLAGEWKVAQVQDDHKKDVEELSFSAPVTFFISPGLFGDSKPSSDSASSRLFLLQAKPYFQTDFGFRHEIYGVQVSPEYVGNLFGSRALVLGGYQDTGIRNLQYQIRVVPKLDYSATARGGIHTTRQEGDDWLRLGGLGSFDLRLGLQTFNELDTGASYQLLQAVSGSGGYAYLFKAHLTLWLVENIGATLEYTKGETPVADKPIDLTSFGVEFRY